MQTYVVDGITRMRYMMGWISPERILTDGDFIEVSNIDFDKFISTINYRRKSYSDCTVYYNARDEADHLAYHYDDMSPNRYIIKGGMKQCIQ